MRRWACTVCSFAYDPQVGYPPADLRPGVPFSALPADWRCPWCGAPKSEFVPEE